MRATGQSEQPNPLQSSAKAIPIRFLYHKAVWMPQQFKIWLFSRLMEEEKGAKAKTEITEVQIEVARR